MVAGHLQEKNNFYYIVLSYKDETGKRRTKWESTGLPVKKNKKKAEALLQERRRNFIPPVTVAEIRLDEDILFADFMLKMCIRDRLIVAEKIKQKHGGFLYEAVE